MRSKLFVPATRSDLIGKALASGADAVSIDLEDAVIEARKHEAREAAGRFLQGRSRTDTTPHLIVRVNPVGGGHWQADLQAVMHRSLDLVNLPKIESVQSILDAATAVEVLERERGIPSPEPLLVNIETPLGLARAAQLAHAHPRVAGLQIGFGDLFAATGIAADNAVARSHVRMVVSLAAAQAGIPCYDGAFANVHETGELDREAREAHAFGFAGKSCIHPSQVAVVNAAFTPTADELAWAHRLLQAARMQAECGAYLLDGQMVDEPILRRARRLLDSATR